MSRRRRVAVMGRHLQRRAAVRPPPPPTLDTHEQTRSLAGGRTDGLFGVRVRRSSRSVGPRPLVPHSVDSAPSFSPLPCSIRPPLATAERLLYMMEAMLRANTELRKEAFVMGGWKAKGGKRDSITNSLIPSMPSRLSMLGEKCMQEATWTIALRRNRILATLQKWLHWKLEGRGSPYAGRFKYRPVRASPLQSARANCESSKGRKRNNNKGHGNKGGKARPSVRLFGKGYSGNKINRGPLSCYGGYCW